MSSPNYKEFDDGDYTRLRQRLIRKDEHRVSRQREFLELFLHGGRFVDCLDREIAIVGDDELDPLADKLSEAEFRDPPPDTEHRLFEAWADLTPRIACRTTFWGHVTWRHIKEGRIEPSYLAANGGSVAGGTARIEQALDASEGEAPKLLDACVRTVLRRLGGLPEARGNRTIYVNCPLARAWWRERFVKEAAGDDPNLTKQVREVVRIRQEYWERLVLYVVSRNSVFGSPRIRTALVRSIGAHIHTDPRSPLREQNQFLRPVCRSLSTLQASREISVLPSNDIEEIIEQIVTMHLTSLNARDTANEDESTS